MPVRQERLISLINAAIDYRSLAFTVKEWLSLPQLQHMTRDELAGQITQWIAYINDALVERAANHDTAITLEYHNLNRNRVRNERAKVNMRAKPRRRQDFFVLKTIDSVALSHVNPYCPMRRRYVPF